MDLLRSKRLTNAEYWDAAKEDILKNQKEELADKLFSMPEEVWYNICWHNDINIKKANSSDFNVISTLRLYIGDPLELENILQGKLNRAYRRISTVEALCCDMYHSCAIRMPIDEQPQWTQRMADLGLLEELHEKDNGNR